MDFFSLWLVFFKYICLCLLTKYLNLFAMSRLIYDYTKTVLERVSFDPVLFEKELKKAIRNLLPYEMEHLKKWLLFFTNEKPELIKCLVHI
jgi:DNA replication protein DnaD